MEIKKIILWFLMIGIIALILGLVIGAFTFNVGEFNKKIAECKERINNSEPCFISWEESAWNDTKHKTFWSWDKYCS